MKKVLLIILTFTLLLSVSGCKKHVTVTFLNEQNDITDKITILNLKEGITTTFTTQKKETQNYIKLIKDNRNIYEITRIVSLKSQIGWIDEEENIFPETIITKKDLVLRPLYTTKSDAVKVRYILTNGELDESELNRPISQLYNLCEPNPEKYDFNGWYNNFVLSGTKESYIEDTYNGIDEFVFYGSCKYTLSYYRELQKEAVNKINEGITKIPNKVSIDDEPLIDELLGLYESLSNVYKQEITNYDKLYQSKEYILLLKKVNKCNEDIKEILNTTQYSVSMYYNLLNIVEVYNQLLAEDRHLLSNYEEALLKETKLTSYYAVRKQEAEEIEYLINTIPSGCTYNYLNEIKNTYDKYLQLCNDSRLLVENSFKIISLKNEMDQLINNDKNVYIIKTPTQNNIYTSKNALRNAFFTDFYYFILSIDGGVKLKDQNIHTLTKFLDLATDEYGGQTNAFRGIGNIAGEYLLAKDLNGVIENQPITKFLGFCYQNNIYTDFINFYYNAFAYWRIDEKYANKNNYGADLFAEAWAPTVDLAKFFHYNITTSYVRTDRMIDCLEKVSSVAYGFDGTYLPILTLRGYKFVGWYDNEEFSGMPIETINEYEKHTLFAKFEIDEEQSSSDKANFIDNYIYNLSTNVANVSKTTVSYVRIMIEKCDDLTKSKIKSLEIFEIIEKGVA